MAIGTGTAIALGVSALIGAGASKQSSDAQGASTRKARQAGTAAAGQATDVQLEMYYQGRDDLAPWREAGANALEQLYGKKTYGLDDPGDAPEQSEFAGKPGGTVNFKAATDKWEADVKAYEDSATYQPGLIQDPSGFDPTKQPGYKFGFENFIQKPYEQAAAAGGKRLSGQTLKDLTGYASDYGSTKYDNYLSKFMNVAGMGQASAAGSANLAQNAGNQIGQNIMAGGAYNQAGIIGQGNANAQGIAGMAGAGQNALQSYMDYKILQKVGGGTNALSGMNISNQLGANTGGAFI